MNHAPTMVRPAANAVERGRSTLPDAGVSGWERRSRHLPPGAATRHLKCAFHVYTFAQAVGRFAPLHLGRLGEPPLPIASLVNRPAGQQVN